MTNKTIIVVDDEEQIRFCIALILKMKGYTVLSFSDGEDALKTIMQMQYTGQNIDLLICDILLKKLSGEELIDKIHSFKFSIPVMIISGFGDKETIVRLMRKGCRDFLDKPFEPVELENHVEKILKEYGNSANFQGGFATRQFAHDINNILCAAIGYAEIILGEMDEGHPAQKQVSKLLGVTTRAVEVCKTILSPVNNNQKEFQVIDLVELVKNLQFFFADVFSDMITLKICAEEAHIWSKVNVEQIKTVLMNLCFNAAQAMPDGGILTIEIKLSDQECERKAVIAVSDIGCGISKENMPFVFTEGFTTKENGSGIGLCIVKKIVEKHGGSIDVKSEIGVGSIFTIKLPVENNGNEIIDYGEQYGK